MNKYPRTHLKIYILLIFVFLFASLPALAQNGKTSSNSAQAVLHIRINLVQTVALPPPTTTISGNNAVSYNFSTVKPNVEVREEIRPLLGSGFGQSVDGKGAVLKTLTIVPH